MPEDRNPIEPEGLSTGFVTPEVHFDNFDPIEAARLATEYGFLFFAAIRSVGILQVGCATVCWRSMF
jgi:hypothetical protein